MSGLLKQPNIDLWEIDIGSLIKWNKVANNNTNSYESQ
jgi:hypothetical protein